ncbi:WD40 repeat-like protein [Meira miltonrushii]|uniref:WD40 repeat-like protein n=1 Tax=Meira miltonrushii TaxID=1280837 RepID=A0A316VIR9_9BASI|nr:WD40 repeat-like protein [Meira miltonrushii]PWN35911.1 WD40 repeat-like protein [Meira miltonrushii]
MTDTVAGPSKSAPSVPLHRVRFVDWAPSSVSALAFLPLTKQVQSASSTARSILAVGRENGNIDLCVWVEDDGIDASKLDDSQSNSSSSASVAKGWVVDTTLVGSNPSKVDSLVFVLSPTVPYNTPRLFSSSGGAIVTEHYLPPHLIMSSRAPSSSAQFQQLPASIRKDSTLSNVSRSIPSQGGSVWSMAASPLGKHLALGCEDGIVRMIDIADGRFELASYSRSSLRGSDGVVRGNVSQLDRAKARIVSLAWGPPQRKEKAKKAPFVPIGGKKRQDDSDSDSSDSDSDDDDDDEWDDSFVLGGTAQSLAYVWSANTGRVITKLVVDRSRNQQTIVWSCATLLDGTCVLGDSMGQVSFYDGKMFTLLPGARFTSHGKGADVLSLCVGSDGQCVYSASVDQKVVEYTRVGVAKQTKWMISGKRRLHAHDIRALAIDPPFNPKSLLSSSDGDINRLPILVSAGVDFHLTLTPAASPSRATLIDTTHPKQQSESKEQEDIQKTSRIPKQSRFDHINPVSTTPITTFADTIHRRLPFVPTTGKGSALGGGSVIRICAVKRWVILRREKSIAIWKLPLQANAEEEENSKKVDWKIVLEMQIRVQSNLVCAEISQDGRFLFVSDLYESKLFELQENGKDIVPKRIKSFSTKTFASQGVQQGPASSAATFTPDHARLVLASYPGAFVHVVDLPRSSDSQKCTLLKSFAEHRQAAFGRSVAGKASDGESEETSEDKNQSANEPRTTFARIDTIQVSSDGQYLISIDAAKRIHCYSLDTLHHRGALPSPAHQPNAVTFDPWKPHMMCCILPTNQTVVYDLERRQANFTGNTSKPATSTTSKEMGKKALKAVHRMRHRGEEGFIAALNEELMGVRDNAIGLFWLSPTVLAVWGATFLCTAKRIQITAEGQNTNVPRNGKRAHPDESSVDLTNAGQHDQQSDHYWRARLVTKYQPLLYAGIVPGSASSETELVVVERPYYDVASSLPPTYFSGASYGT